MGEVLAVLTALVWASMNIFMRYGVVQKKSGSIFNIRLVMAAWGVMSVLLVFCILFLLGVDLIVHFKSLTTNIKIFWLFVLDGVLTKIVALLLLTIALGQIGASRTAAVRAIDAVFTCVLSVFLLEENVGYIQIGAALLVAGGVALANLNSEKEAVTAGATSHISIKGSVIALAAALCFSFGNIARGSAIDSGGSYIAGVLINYLICFMVYGAIYLCSLLLGATYKEIGSKSLRFYRYAGIMDVVGTFTLFAAFTFAPVWLVVTLKSTQPIIVMVLSAVFLKESEQINIRVILSSFLVVIGACIIVAT